MSVVDGVSTHDIRGMGKAKLDGSEACFVGLGVDACPYRWQPMIAEWIKGYEWAANVPPHDLVRARQMVSSMANRLREVTQLPGPYVN